MITRSRRQDVPSATLTGHGYVCTQSRFDGDDLVRHVHDSATGYRTKHWAAFEFPVVADLETGELAFNRSKPLWGRTYYSGFQDIVDTCLAS